MISKIMLKYVTNSYLIG